MLRVDGPGDLEANSYGDARDLDGSTSLKDGKWHHVAFTYNGNATARLYIDGQNVGQATNWIMDTQSEVASGSYRCIISNNLGNATSNNATLNVVAAPSIITQPLVNQTIVTGNPANLSVVATGIPAPTYQLSLIHI